MNTATPSPRTSARRGRTRSRSRPRLGGRWLTPALLLLTLAALLGSAPIAGRAQDAAPAATVTAEEELARRHAPIVYLKRQVGECDEDGEAYRPAPVEIAFGDPAVILRQAPAGDALQRGVAGGELYGRDAAHYVDLPGHPRTPGCGYERHARARMADQPSVVYAHIATEEVDGEPNLALQYWFWYYFNDFNDKHEGDWEMIQLRFDAASAEAALDQEPVAVAYSQHTGGESVDWDAPLLETEEGRPVVYSSRGSHASFFGPGVWIGWGQGGAGLGCDVTTGPSDRVEPEVRLVPDEITGADHPFAWATFGGRWGERDTWVYDGPRGPNLNRRWEQPISWQEGLGAGALRLQTADVLGPTPTEIFCDLVATGSTVFTLFKPYPWLVGGTLALLVLLAGGLLLAALPVLGAAWRVYREHLGVFVAIGAVIVPLTLAVNGFHYLLSTEPGVTPPFGLTEDSPAVLIGLGIALDLQRAALLLLVGPAVIQAVADTVAGRTPGFARSYRTAFRRFWRVLGAVVVAQGIPFLLAVTIVALPLSIFLGVRWALVAQAVVIDGATPRAALTGSAQAVSGRWWRALAVGLVLLTVGAALGPLVGIALMVGIGAPPDLANGVSGALYALTHPFAIVGATLFFQQRREPSRVDEAAAAPARRPWAIRRLATGA